jgi:NAD(P)-dependent dehydrogenase (short-subunit alcohol dehydrogenase family)
MTMDFDGRTALVTGASRGIGRAVALALGRAGAHVVAVARGQGGLEELDDELRQAASRPATLVPLDLADGPGIDRLGGALYQRFGHLDILIGNAAVLGPLTPVPHIGPDEWDDVVAVNITANLRLIRAFDPLLRAAPAGRAVFTTSASSWLHKPFWGAYAASKAALECLVKAYAAEVARTNVRANLVAPGGVATAMRARAFPGEDPARLAKPEDVAPLFLELAAEACAANGEILNFPDWRAGR